MRRWLILAALLLPWTLAAQTGVTVTALWDLAPDHDAPGLTWELERDGTIHPCGSVTVTATERRCTATVPAATGVYRLRGLTAGGEPGPWSVEGTPGTQTAPGQFTILWHGPITLTEPEPEPGGSVAKTFTAQTSGSDQTGDGPYTTASVSPTSGATLYLAVVVGGMGGQAAGSVTVSGLSGTWTRVAHYDPTNDFADYPMWWFSCADWSGSGAATITATGGSAFGAWWGLVEVTADGAISIVGTPTTGAASGASSATASMPAFSDAANQALVAFAQVATSSGTTPGTGMTELIDQAAFFGGGRLQVAYGTANDNSPDASTGGDTGDWQYIALEIAEAAGGGGADAEGALIVPASTLAASITVSRSVSAAMTIPAATLTAAAMVDRTVSAAMTAGAMALASSVAIAREVAGALEIAGLDLGANLANDRTVSGALTLPPSTLSAVAARTVAVEGALDVPSPLLAAITDAGRTVNGALTLPPATLSAAVARVVEAEGSLALPVPTLTAAVSVARFASGELALAVPVLAASVETEALTVSGALVLPMPVLDADAMVSRTASGALSLSMPVLDGDVMRAVHVDGVLLLRGLTLEATATIARMASGDLDAPALVAAATAIIGALQPVMLTRADTVSLVPVRDTLSQVPVRDVLSLMPVRDVEAL